MSNERYKGPIGERLLLGAMHLVPMFGGAAIGAAIFHEDPGWGPWIGAAGGAVVPLLAILALAQLLDDKHN